MAWPNFHREMEREVDKQVAAPAETRTPNLHRAKQIENSRFACGWFPVVLAKNTTKSNRYGATSRMFTADLPAFCAGSMDGRAVETREFLGTGSACSKLHALVRRERT